MSASTKKEAAHYVVTAHPPGGVLLTAKCNFTSPFSLVSMMLLVLVLLSSNRVLLFPDPVTIKTYAMYCMLCT